jgi:nucleoside phosphorylase
MNRARPASRGNFEIAILCALRIEAEAVRELFDHDWEDDGRPYDKAPGDPNAYSTGLVGRHNVVLAHLPKMGKATAAAVASTCRRSFPNVKLALIVGVCGVVPIMPDGKTEIVLGDIVLSTGVIQYDLGRQLPEQFERRDTLQDSLGRPNMEIRALLEKLGSLQDRKKLQSKLVGHLTGLQKETELEAEYPGIAQDRLFESKYRHKIDGQTCEECRCDGDLILRRRFDQGVPQPAIHFWLIAS